VIPFIPEQFRFDALIERIWRARVRKNPKEAKAQRSVAAFHKANPDNVTSLREWRMRRDRSKTDRTVGARAL
jgi:hypothetical protein